MLEKWVAEVAAPDVTAETTEIGARDLETNATDEVRDLQDVVHLTVVVDHALDLTIAPRAPRWMEDAAIAPNATEVATRTQDLSEGMTQRGDHALRATATDDVGLPLRAAEHVRVTVEVRAEVAAEAERVMQFPKRIKKNEEVETRLP